jgi:hypothetical protein
MFIINFWFIINLIFNHVKTRNVNNKERNTYDLPAFDILRSRDRGMKLKFIEISQIFENSNK